MQTRTSGRARTLVGALGALALGSAALVLTGGSAAAATTTTGGELSWGVKQSFRSYITGPIAKGTVTPSAGATQAADGTFRFPAGSGTVDGDAVTAATSGTVAFSGHGRQLDLTITDVRVTFTGDEGSLVADVRSRSLSGGTVETYDDVALADLDLSGVTPTGGGGTQTWSAVPATLTAEGAPAFGGFYTAGTELDPVSLTLTTASTGGGGGEEPAPAPGTRTQQLVVEVPTTTPPTEPTTGSFAWEVTGDDSAVSLGTAEAGDGGLTAAGEIKPVRVTDTRSSRAAWSVTAQVGDFTSAAGTLPGKHLGWTPQVLTAGGGAVAGAAVAPSLGDGAGLGATSTLASAPTGHETGSALVGADLDLRLPTGTPAGSYTATLTLTALS